MRIIAGLHRGRKLLSSKGIATRPMLDRVRESLFNILAHLVPEATFLDLFAGTGAVGLEALSRGAASCTFVEHDPAALETLKRNVQALQCEHRSRVIAGDVTAALEVLARCGPYDLVFMGPPYRMTGVGELVDALVAHAVPAPGGLIIVQHEKRQPVRVRSPDLYLADERTYGITGLSFFEVRIEGGDGADRDLPGDL